MTQVEMVLDYMNEFGSISSMEAFTDLGITRLAARVSDAEKMGVRIERKSETAKNRYGQTTHYTRYFIAKETKQ